MNSPAFAISGGHPVFYGNVSVNIHINSTTSEASRVCDQLDYLEVKLAEEKDYNTHRGKDEFYQISRHPKGRALIINNEFRGKRYERTGSTQDQRDMADLWRVIGCEVTMASDLTVEALLDKVEEFASPKKESDFYVLIVMSHGKQDDLVIGSESAEVEVKKIVDIIMTSQAFKDKPKLIFFQMCRGNKIECDQADAISFTPTPHDDVAKGLLHCNGNKKNTATPNERGADRFDTFLSAWVVSLLNKVLDHGQILGSSCDEADDHAEDYISETPDIILAFATQPDHMSFRNSSKGSWFIQSIKEVFSKYAATDDVVKMMAKVQEKVRTHRVYAPGRRYDGGKETVDASHTFGKKRLMLFPGFPDPKPE